MILMIFCVEYFYKVKFLKRKDKVNLPQTYLLHTLECMCLSGPVVFVNSFVQALSVVLILITWEASSFVYFQNFSFNRESLVYVATCISSMASGTKLYKGSYKRA